MSYMSTREVPLGPQNLNREGTGMRAWRSIGSGTFSGLENGHPAGYWQNCW